MIRKKGRQKKSQAHSLAADEMLMGKKEKPEPLNSIFVFIFSIMENIYNIEKMWKNHH